MERIYGFCDHSSPADVQTTHAPTNIRTASPLQALRTSNSRRASMATSARAGTRDAPTTATTCSTPLKQELANSSMQRQHNSPQATSSSRRMPSRPFSTIARALEAEEMLSSEDDPNSSAESGQNSMGDSSSGSPAQSSDPGLSTIEERTEISERIHSRPLSGVSAIRRSIDETRQSPRILPRSLTEETGEESEAYSTAADSSAASIPRAEPIDDRQ